MITPPVTLPTPPDEQFSTVRVLDANGQVIATIDAKTRVRTSVTGEQARVPLPVWFSDPKKFHYEHPIVTGEKRSASGSWERKVRRKVRDWN